jgi:uncharacterized membrane protein
MKRLGRILLVSAIFAFLLAPTLALAARSGSSFGGRRGFRSAPTTSAPRSYAPRPGGGSNFIILPGFGWGFSPFGYGGGVGLLGPLMMMTLLGVGTFMVVRAVRRSRARQAGDHAQGAYNAGYDYDDEPVVVPGRAFVYKVQLGLGRSARGLQDRLTKFAAEGDTTSEAGLAHLLQQTALELMREKESIRYAGAESHGPMSMTNGETKMNGLSLAERSRFQVERIRGAEGLVRKADAQSTQSQDALEYILVTLVLATRNPLESVKPVRDREQLDAMLSELGGVSPDGLLGLEVIWTPADPQDALTEDDLMTSYPDLRSV